MKDIFEHNALVNIESEYNESFPLYESGDGIYTSSSLQLNPNEKYRLKIKTSNGKEYASNFSDYRTTPDFDSLTWTRNSEGIKIYINTHDDQNAPGYYNWKYEETWEFHSRFLSSLQWIFDGTGVPIGVGYKFNDESNDTSIYKCWKTVKSSNIIIASTEKLARNDIYYQIMSVASGSEKLSVLYSLNVHQYSLSKEAYIYLQKLKLNTEDIGSIFSVQPSELTGNIHCTTNPSEIVIGFVEVSQEKEKRLFISNSEVPGWNFRQDCQTLIVLNDPDSIQKYAAGLPTVPYQAGLGIISFYDSPDPNCVDCTLRGSNVRPSFWP